MSTVVQPDGFLHIDGKTYCARRAESGAIPGSPFKAANQPDHWRDDHTCSYCGSLNPDAFFEAVTSGQEVGPTDKSYKAYIGTRGKFYFQHFSKEHQLKFIELYNQGQSVMKIGFPGHFYVKPFFVRYE